MAISSHAQPPARFCTECGARLLDGRCPEHDVPSSRASHAAVLPSLRQVLTLTVVSGGVLLAVVVGGFFLVSRQQMIDRRVNELAADFRETRMELEAVGERVNQTHSLSEKVGRQLAEVEARLRETERRQAEQSDLTALASSLQQSVVTIATPWVLGSGFFIADRRGTAVVVTNYHVVEDVWVRGDREVDVRAKDESYGGRIQAVSLTHDLAVIQPERSAATLPVRLEAPKIGETVVAVGSPLGLEGTISTGIVSGLRDQRIQFTAPVGPGNSGGPLVDESGRVVGLIVEKAVGVGVEGISFAIPMEVVCSTITSCQEAQ